MAESTPNSTAFSVSPAEATQALRLGWTIAETRGRFDPSNGQSHYRSPPPPTLLLEAAYERSAIEGQVEATKVLAALGGVGVASVDPIQLQKLSEEERWGPPPFGTDTSQMLCYLASRLIWSRTNKEIDLTRTFGLTEISEDEQSDPVQWWARLQWFLWAWDEALQDQLAAGNFGIASAYQLGRGLAETFWALDPMNPKGLGTRWTFLLGSPRVEALSALCRRLSPALKDFTAPAVEGSVRKWEEVAKLPQSYVEPVQALERQVRIWRDLLVGGRDPLSLVEASDLEKVARDPRPIIKAYRWELMAAFLAAVVLGVAAAFLSSASSAIVTVLSAFGITASALVGWGKARVQSVADRVSKAVNQSVVNDAVETLPSLTPNLSPQKLPRIWSSNQIGYRQRTRLPNGGG